MISRNFHDWLLTSITERGENLELTVVSEDRSRSTLIELCGLRLLRVVDYSTQNVIARCYDSSLHRIDRGAISELLHWTCSREDAGSWLSPENLERSISEIASGQSVLLALTPSNGAELVATCKAA